MKRIPEHFRLEKEHSKVAPEILHFAEEEILTELSS
jgi:hypothetical protein